MFRTKTKAELARERAEEARERAKELAQERAAELGAAASERLQAAKQAARETAAPALADVAEAAKLRLAAAKDAAGPVVHDVAERAKPRVESAQATLVDDLLPRLGAVLAAAAASLAEASEHARDAAAPRVEQAREEAHLYNDRAKDALRVFRGEAVAVEPRGSKAPWLIGIGLAAAAVAAVAAFRQKQRADDPWATPLTDATVRPTFTEKAAVKVEQAKEAVSELAETAKDRASDLAAKGQAAVADAKDRSAEDATTLDSALDDAQGPTGQVTDAPGTGGADAVVGEQPTTGVGGNPAVDLPADNPPAETKTRTRTTKSTAAKPKSSNP